MVLHKGCKHTEKVGSRGSLAMRSLKLSSLGSMSLRLAADVALPGSGADGGPDVPEQLPADQPQGDQLPLLLLDEPAPAGHAGADPADPHVPPHDPEAAAAAGMHAVLCICWARKTPGG